MLLPVPYFSQFLTVTDLTRQRSACSVTCLAMALAYLMPDDAPSPDELYEEGERIGGRDANGNWTHDGIVRLSRNHGVLAYSQEFRSLKGGSPSRYEEEFVRRGIEKIRTSILSGLPVIASIVRRGGATPHTVVIVGVDERGFLVHDPDARKEEDGKYVILSIEEFRNIWRKFAVFFDQKN